MLSIVLNGVTLRYFHFLVFFCLYFFETWAFSNASIPLVSFLTYAAGGVTLILSAYVLKEKLTRVKVLSFGFVVFGVCLIFNYEFVVTGSYFGMFLALIGGLGYALFIFLSKFLKVGCGFSQLVWLFGFGSLYLFVPAVFSGPIEINYNAMVPIFFLVVFPTIGGFYFTTKAIEGSEAGKVQIIETSDPLFATLFGFLIFGQILTIGSLWGASCIVFGLLLVVLSKKK
ncbi:DMT family transporter [Deefgea sp. CFH1-16]|uniref:DMT family transporter n=1 Tax=Deefgea sp. CFH1-16 TaxID=2675457 RepID=UPI0035B0F52A